MLRGNLSTRPFYNERFVRNLLALLALVAIALTVFNLIEILRLERAGRDARQTVARNNEQARDVRQKAVVIRQSINQAQLEAVRISARDANALIDRRAFSWTALLNYFQATLPPDVRVATVTPQIDDDGRMLVAISVFARRFDDLSEFQDALENTGAFTDVLSRQLGQEEDGSLRAEIQGYYSGPAPAAATAPASSSEPAKTDDPAPLRPAQGPEPRREAPGSGPPPATSRGGGAR
jgi:Tfp pilus assembly protein PilN